MANNLKDITYFKTYIEHVLSNYGSMSVEKELVHRNLISRMYYTAFLHCRNELQIEKRGDNSHVEVIDSIKNKSVHTQLRDMRNVRNEADYQNYYIKDKFPLTYLQTMKRKMDFILTKNKTDLLS
jgi:hypothetical protein